MDSDPLDWVPVADAPSKPQSAAGSARARACKKAIKKASSSRDHLLQHEEETDNPAEHSFSTATQVDVP